MRLRSASTTLFLSQSAEIWESRHDQVIVVDGTRVPAEVCWLGPLPPEKTWLLFRAQRDAALRARKTLGYLAEEAKEAKAPELCAKLAAWYKALRTHKEGYAAKEMDEIPLSTLVRDIVDGGDRLCGAAEWTPSMGTVKIFHLEMTDEEADEANNADAT